MDNKIIDEIKEKGKEDIINVAKGAVVISKEMQKKKIKDFYTISETGGQFYWRFLPRNRFETLNELAMYLIDCPFDIKYRVHKKGNKFIWYYDDEKKEFESFEDLCEHWEKQKK